MRMEIAAAKHWHFLCLLGSLLFTAFAASFANAEVHYHNFNIQQTPVKRLCRTHDTITVNGQFPGPTIAVRNGDTLVVRVVNNARYNATIHWHGIRQMRTPWADGPAFITQCPIRPGGAYTYRFTIENQEGTLWWHAHSRWLRATVYGALIIYPRLGTTYPFPAPKAEFPVLLGEWFDRDPNNVLRLAQWTGGGPNVSDAYTINGQPGDLYRCSRRDTIRIPVQTGQTVLLRIVNAALNQELFFSVANHRLTVVGADAEYTKPFTTNVIEVGPGQTTDVLMTPDQRPGRYYMAARAYATGQNVPFDNTTTTAILEYRNIPRQRRARMRPVLPRLPAFNDSNTVFALNGRHRSLTRGNVPLTIDHNLFFTVGLGLFNCTGNPQRCQGPNGTRFAASMNNVSGVLPSRNSILQAWVQGNLGIFTTNFPPVPPVQFNYTGNVPRQLWQPMQGTEVYPLKYGSNVQIVLQDTAIVTTEDHPMHLHGYHFYVLAQGIGNFNAAQDTAKFNLIDPPYRNTVGVPPGGWVVIRFKADNPGAWLMHCHLDIHLTWGLAMTFLVGNGVGELESMLPPPPDLPQC
ncbi:hypothetical protein QQ045_003186 [Rhodiola kirilowii]